MATHTPKSIRALLDAVRAAKRDPNICIAVPGDFPITGRELLCIWRNGVNARASRGLPALTDAQESRYADLRNDARIINDASRRVRWPGLNLLRDPRMQRRYPAINNHRIED